MPARPHRTVDRVTGILETVSLSPRGVTLAELANALDAAKSSVQELTNGLLARGYLVEEDGRSTSARGRSSWRREPTRWPRSQSTTGSSSS
jgi:hypothetical protein